MIANLPVVTIISRSLFEASAWKPEKKITLNLFPFLNVHFSNLNTGEAGWQLVAWPVWRCYRRKCAIRCWVG
ncbi:hypothetical protein PANT111_190223 [Pantoea brenneri]|uniref:Uncharacterized protein n=1 Tax=Pantoea brenneri TaxID=472694 RepID=A0AAX3J842_9GAMM|nr:hypothetical protein PANT111_190223 [Pantoea brenneri]